MKTHFIHDFALLSHIRITTKYNVHVRMISIKYGEAFCERNNKSFSLQKQNGLKNITGYLFKTKVLLLLLKRN
jgi:hypothetical protein